MDGASAAPGFDANGKRLDAALLEKERSQTADLSARVVNQTARIAELEHELAGAREIQAAQADIIALRNAEIISKDAALDIVRHSLKAPSRAESEPAREAELQRHLADCRHANTALQESSAHKDRQLDEARAEIDRLTRELEGAHSETAFVASEAGRDEIAATREARAFWRANTEHAEGALLGLAYRLGQLERRRMASKATEAAREACVDHHLF
ncbi:MAG: hypothetical protein KGL39_55855, partial [Patescibacteria group bacterium]|nr:hypothetical protein [Patescibacteria group bacterium]